MATEPEEANRPRLNWPEHDLVPASRRGDNRQVETPEPEPEEVEPEEPPSASVLFTVASRLEGLKTSLATMGARVEALAKSEEQFREFTTARLGKHARQIADAMRDISTELADRAKTQDKALGALQAGVDDGSRAARESAEELDQLRQRSEEMGQSIEVLAGQVQAVAEDMPSLRAELIDFIARTDTRDEELASELNRLVDEVKVLRRRTPVRAAAAAAPRRAARRVEREEPDEDDEDFIVEEPAPSPRRRAPRTRRTE